MARFPKIDRPCPLDIDAQRRINGHCGHCGKTVHCLDGKSDAERAELLRKTGGTLCVSYTLTAGIGAALALSMAAPVSAAQAAPDSPLPTLSASPGQQDPLGLRTEKPTEQTPLDSSLDRIVMVGGIDVPGDAEWIDDSQEELPELPMRRETPQPRHD